MDFYHALIILIVVLVLNIKFDMVQVLQIIAGAIFAGLVIYWLLLQMAGGF